LEAVKSRRSAAEMTTGYKRIAQKASKENMLMKYYSSSIVPVWLLLLNKVTH
jgi:hypothetical protein